MFAAFIVAGNMASGDPTIARRYLPYAFAAALIGLDLLLRMFQWRKIVNRPRLATLITREGRKVPPRRPAREVAEALFSNNAGGQYFHVIPVWTIGVALIILALCWQPSWSAWLSKTTAG
jgi:hypothetical protein